MDDHPERRDLTPGLAGVHATVRHALATGLATKATLARTGAEAPSIHQQPQISEHHRHLLHISLDKFRAWHVQSSIVGNHIGASGSFLPSTATTATTTT